MLEMRNPLVFLDWSTNAYQPRDLSLNLPRATFTNHYHRGEGDGGQGTDLGVVDSVVATGAVGSRVITVENDATAWHSVENRGHTQKGLNGGWSVSKRKKKKI